MTEEEYNAFCASIKATKYERMGQFTFNLLHLCFRDIANEIRGTEFDPFYVDEKIPILLKHLRDNYVR